MSDVAPTGAADQRRFAAPGGADAQLAIVSTEWRNIVIDYEDQALLQAQAEADYKIGLKTKIREFKVLHKGMSAVAIRELAESEDDLLTAHLNYLLESARLDAMKKKIDWLKAEMDRLRTAAVNEREERKLDTRHQPG